ncbi:hypothetical protein NT6N_03760 [Oceaniferula spumae]|uniref:Uncharacterized protein n=1 Tax=Oceaniferula spumae TaxID=2979115 RepID=A0AAT9FH69_9BACT
MKTILATLATIIVSFAALPEKAEAAPHPHHIGHSYTYCSGHAPCGCRVYKRRIIVGYDCYHRPIYRYYSVPVVHRCHRYCAPALWSSWPPRQSSPVPRHLYHPWSPWLDHRPPIVTLHPDLITPQGGPSWLSLFYFWPILSLNLTAMRE